MTLSHPSAKTITNRGLLLTSKDNQSGKLKKFSKQGGMAEDEKDT
jgi:hypothetical protein